jgi:hypothetical protein
MGWPNKFIDNKEQLLGVEYIEFKIMVLNARVVLVEAIWLLGYNDFGRP